MRWKVGIKLIQIKQEDYNTIVHHAKEGLPNEACGLLGGVTIDGVTYVKKVYCLKNIDASREHFSMDAKEQLTVIKDIRSNDWQLIGNFHSHPETPARPSEEDKRLAYDSKLLYGILSLMDEELPVLKVFHISEEKEVSVEEVAIVE